MLLRERHTDTNKLTTHSTYPGMRYTQASKKYIHLICVELCPQRYALLELDPR